MRLPFRPRPLFCSGGISCRLPLAYRMPLPSGALECRLGPLLCSRPHLMRPCLLGFGRISGLPSHGFPFLGGLFGRHEMPPLQLHNDHGFFPCLDPRSGSGMTDKSKDKDSETLDSCFSPSVILAFPPSVILDIFNRGSRVFFFSSCSSGKRHWIPDRGRG